MAEATIQLASQEEELAVFGSRDQFLKLVREGFQVRVVARHGEVRVEGADDRVEAARQVFEELKRWFKLRRVAATRDVLSLIEDLQYAATRPASSGPEFREGDHVVRARTGGQSAYMRALQENELVFCVGPAGTGKTFLAVAMAISEMRHGRTKKIVLVRPAVEAGEHLGFLPGDLEAKINPYLRPLFDALNDLMTYDQIRRYIANDMIEVAPLAYMRGRTLKDAIIILDEGQNATIAQMKMFLTRMGTNARIVVTGDTSQVDLPGDVESGLADAVVRLANVPGIGIVTLGREDIVRHPLVQAIVDAYDKPELPAQPPAIVDRGGD